jgi:hypothetical protein
MELEDIMSAIASYDASLKKKKMAKEDGLGFESIRPS